MIRTLYIITSPKCYLCGVYTTLPEALEWVDNKMRLKYTKPILYMKMKGFDEDSHSVTIIADLTIPEVFYMITKFIIPAATEDQNDMGENN